VIAPEVDTDLLLDLKKRNYLNIVLVDASFKHRLGNFLKERKAAESLETIREFMEIDDSFHNEEF
jgi:hypothetical protein